MLFEVVGVLAREKFALKGSQVRRYLSILESNSKIVGDNPIFKIIVEDSDDDVVLNVAYCGKADYVVTGDKHLLALKKFKQAKIVNVARMLEILG